MKPWVRGALSHLVKLILNVKFKKEFHVCVSHSCEAHVSEYFSIQLLADFENMAVWILKKASCLWTYFINWK